MNRLFRLAVLASGRGSNLAALIAAQKQAKLAVRFVGVFSDKPDSGAISLAKEHGIHGFVRRPKEFADRRAYDESLFNAVDDVQPDLIVCAGYMRLISPEAVRRFEARMINIHPSLLPKYPGLDTHARALAAGDAEHGASVHVVIPELDSGPVLAQARIALHADDTPESAARRLLSREHPLLVQCVKAISEGRVRLGADRIEYDGRRLERPLQLDDRNELRLA